ncbi:MAG: hypothetical protein AAB728_00700, partial [Patescibacteria group bacterium]
VLYLRAIRDGAIDATERGFLRLTLPVMRAGLILLVLSGFGYLLAFRLAGDTMRLYSPVFWAKMTIALVLVLNSFLLHIRRIPVGIGSALSFTSWYAALILGSWRGMQASYGSILLLYAVAVAVVGVVLRLLDRAARPPPSRR